ncbi:unnamed protein product [Linum trigynum]|uniref:Uncharacterized protein n=1 Tax=Linum trigynum TaxID=586398 RepID=A0AAV2DB43_9ROSI
MLSGSVKEVSISCSLDAQSSIVYFTIDDPSSTLEVMFPTAQLRQIAGNVFTADNLDRDVNFRAILSSIHGNPYHFIVEVGEWNETSNRCDLILLKLFAV